MANLKEIVYLSNADANELFSYGSVTIDGTTLVYDENAVYMTPIDNATTTEDGLMSSSDKTKLDGINLSNLVTTNTAQTISASKTFSASPILNNNIGLQWKNSSNTAVDVLKVSTGNYVHFGNGLNGVQVYGDTFPATNNTYDLGTSSYKWRNLYVSGNVSLGSHTITTNTSYIGLNLSGTEFYRFGSTVFRPATDNSLDLGTSSYRWKNIYLAGTIRNDNANYGLALPTMSSWTANKTIATTDDLLEVTFGTSEISGATKIKSITVGTDSYNFAGGNIVPSTTTWDPTDDTNAPTIKAVTEYVNSRITTALNTPV